MGRREIGTIDEGDLRSSSGLFGRLLALLTDPPEAAKPSDGGGGHAKDESKLPPALRGFVTIAKMPEVKALIKEVQICHASLLLARKGLPGHVVYGRVRNCTELKDFLGLLDALRGAAAVAALRSQEAWGTARIVVLGVGFGPSVLYWGGCPIAELVAAGVASSEAALAPMVELVLEGHTDWMTSVCVTADGAYVVSGSWDKTARVWSMADSAMVRVLKGHTDWVTSVCVTADGAHVVSGSYDETARGWLAARLMGLAARLRNSCGAEGAASAAPQVNPGDPCYRAVGVPGTVSLICRIATSSRAQLTRHEDHQGTRVTPEAERCPTCALSNSIESRLR